MARKSILAVDDDASTLFYLEQVLGGEGHTVSTANSGQAALTCLESDVPDLILLDVMMPGMGGYDVLETIRRDGRTARVPVIFLTVKDAPEDQAKGLKEGVVDYLSKDILTPEKVEILCYRIRNFFAWQENERLRGVLATIVSANHEINNPLMVIVGNAEILKMQEGLKAHPEVGESLDRISEACQRVKKVLERISGLTAWEVKPYLDGVEMLDLEVSRGA